MVTFGPQNSAVPEPSSIELLISSKLAKIKAETRVVCSIVQVSSDGILVNNKPFKEEDSHELDLPLIDAQGQFKIQQKGDAFVLIFDSKETGLLELQIPKDQEMAAVFLGNNFYLAPVSVRLNFKEDGTLWCAEEQLSPEMPVKLGVGELFVFNKDGQWFANWKHPDDTTESFPNERTSSVMTLSGEYELTYCFGRLMTFSHALVEVSDSSYMINGKEVSIGEARPFHLDEEGKIWLEINSDELYICYGNGYDECSAILSEVGSCGKFDVSYNSGPGIEIVALA